MRNLLNPHLFFAFLVAAACQAPAEPQLTEEEDDDIVVPEGKQDDFFSSSAKEYTVSGAATVTIEEALAGQSAEKKLARARQLVALKTVQISWFLNALLIDKEDEEANNRYGGFGALTRFASEDTGAVTAVNGRSYRFSYQVQVAGSKNLIARIPGMSTAGGKAFTLQMGKISNEDLARLAYNHEWYRDSPWDEFDPAKLPAAQLEALELSIAVQPGTKDAYLAYDRLFADGQLTIAAHFGWDYHSRYDIIGSRVLYNWLVQQGFRSPAASYEQYEAAKGPLEKTITSNKKAIAVKFWLYHPGDAANGVPGPDPDTDAGGKALEADMRKSLATHEVIIFEGHSGSLYGFALANWRKTEEGDLDDSEIPGLPLPKDYQIVLANGCDTYALGQAFYANPQKADKKNINVITSTSFSNAGTEASAKRLVLALVNQRYGKVAPVKVSELVSGLDADQGPWFNTMYGVHGVDANPKYDPMADKARLCQACSSNGACAADGNRCTRISTTQRVCSYGCIDDSGCPTGYACRQIASSTTSTIKSRQCVPRSLKCP